MVNTARLQKYKKIKPLAQKIDKNEKQKKGVVQIKKEKN